MTTMKRISLEYVAKYCIFVFVMIHKPKIVSKYVSLNTIEKHCMCYSYHSIGRFNMMSIIYKETIVSTATAYVTFISSFTCKRHNSL